MSGSCTQSARIASRLLDITERALFSNDLEAFLGVTYLPFKVDTFDGPLTMQTPQDVANAFNAVVADNLKRNITSYQRDLVSAEATGPDEINYTYVTRRLSGHMLVDKAYPSIATAKLDGEIWKIASAQHAIEDAPELRDLFEQVRQANMMTKKAP